MSLSQQNSRRQNLNETKMFTIGEVNDESRSDKGNASILTLSLGSQRTRVATVRHYLQNYLKLQSDRHYTIKEPFEKPWYKHENRTSKHRLGRLFYASVR